jgi:predicted transcriptional regulator
MRGTLVTHQELKTMRAMRAAGRLVRDIARATGRNRKTVQRLTADIPGPRAARFVTDAEAAEMRRLRERGLSFQRIATDLGRDASTVWNHVHGIPSQRPPVAARNARLVLAWSAADCRGDREAIAARFGLKNVASAASIVCQTRRAMREAA